MIFIKINYPFEYYKYNSIYLGTLHTILIKLKEKLNVANNLTRAELEKTALSDDKVKALTEGKQVVKVIAVPNKLVNIVIK